MNDYIFIAMPAWIYWLLAGYMVIDATRILLALLNELLAWRGNKRT